MKFLWRVVHNSFFIFQTLTESLWITESYDRQRYKNRWYSQHGVILHLCLGIVNVSSQAWLRSQVDAFLWELRRVVSKSIPRSDTDANHVEEMINWYRFGVMIAGRIGCTMGLYLFIDTIPRLWIDTAIQRSWKKWKSTHKMAPTVHSIS